ncbi:alpha-(1,3)-fucosyltransferase fut-5-like [Ruditapes philippinarum]|uniref:alpha-(1,3)-fucosyltransferase fut-5-like n=1 Tax=Ruditapes philippinarum TaxID=129788 RepID=UPI00295BF5B3|nr:alpha-(1,3)-fucosyltransferase fut-5-like [Ruditapes philippinarum]
MRMGCDWRSVLNIMIKKGLFRWLKLLIGLIAIVTISLLIHMNVQYNLTGYMPYSISSTFENIKGVYRGSSQDWSNNGTRTHHRIENRLIGFNKGVRTVTNRNVDQRVPNDTIKDILWFNKPPWYDIRQQNRFLRTNCTYLNCRMSTDVTNLQKYSAIIYALTESASHVPPISHKDRNPDQMWIFFYSESPVYQGKLAFRHTNWRNTMNWSMSYNIDADIFRPYGYLIENKEIKHTNYSAIYHRKSTLVSWAVSHCDAQSKRDQYVSELVSNGIEVDIFGTCGNMPYHDHQDLRNLLNTKYKFYLSFENSFCEDYFTEKFINFYNLDIILIVRGGLNYDKYLPNDTFINTAHFSSAKELSDYIVKVGSSEELYTSYLRKKSRYIAKHVYEMPQTSCMLCEKLNNLNEYRKTYIDHVTYVHDRKCWTPNDITEPTFHWLAIVLVLLFVFCFILFLWKCKPWSFLARLFSF